MSSQTGSRSDQKSEDVPLVIEHEVLKAKYEALCKEHETLIQTLEVIEKTHEDELNKQREVIEKTHEDDLNKQREVVSKEEGEKWKDKFLEMEKRVEKLNTFIEGFIPSRGVDDSGTTEAENVNVTSNVVVDEGVITISDDEEGNHRESNGGYCNLRNEVPEFSFVIRR